MNMKHEHKINNLGLPPLAGICTYEEAARIGYSVDHNVELLKRYNYIKTRTYLMLTAHIPQTPEWEVKSAISYHIWLESEHSLLFRKRVSEMRNPPLGLDKSPDPSLSAWMDEAIRSSSTIELLTAVYRVIKPEMIRSLNKHLAETNPLVDAPTCRMIRIILAEEASMVEWGEQAIQALLDSDSKRQAAIKWESHLQYYVAAAGGISGDYRMTPHGDHPTPRSDGQDYVMDVYPKRDERMHDTYNAFHPITVFNDESRDALERTYALICMRLREMDVPEYMSPIIYKTKDKPWEYYVDMGRQLFDEARHSMMGEAALVNEGIPFYDFPIQMVVPAAFNTELTPLETHAVLWGVEQSLMPKATGKAHEWDIAIAAGHELVAMFQDYDWADEVLHAQIGRKWLSPEFNDMAEMNAYKDMSIHKLEVAMLKFKHLSQQDDWWSLFMERARSIRNDRQ
jgi:hypothetical protein